MSTALCEFQFEILRLSLISDCVKLRTYDIPDDLIVDALADVWTRGIGSDPDDPEAIESTRRFVAKTLAHIDDLEAATRAHIERLKAMDEPDGPAHTPWPSPTHRN